MGPASFEESCFYMWEADSVEGGEEDVLDVFEGSGVRLVGLLECGMY